MFLSVSPPSFAIGSGLGHRPGAVCRQRPGVRADLAKTGAPGGQTADRGFHFPDFERGRAVEGGKLQGAGAPHVPAEDAVVNHIAQRSL